MTAGTVAPSTTSAVALDAGDLSSFGYAQQLHRTIGSYGSFAAGFSFVRRQRSLATPLIDLELFRSPTFAASMALIPRLRGT